MRYDSAGVESGWQVSCCWWPLCTDSDATDSDATDSDATDSDATDSDKNLRSAVHVTESDCNNQSVT